MNKFISLTLIILYCFGEDISPVYYSQFKQDEYLNNAIFKNKKNGVFIDIGAYDGVLLSNSYFFEKSLGWHGICIEPMPHVYKQLCENRSAICIEGCINPDKKTAEFLMISGYSDMLSGIIDLYDPLHMQRVEHEVAIYNQKAEKITVACYQINDILSENDISHVDYLSLDTEGGEYEILTSIDYDTYTIDVLSVENNFKEERFRKFLSTKGYRLVKNLGCDEIYIHNRIKLE